MKTPDSPLVTQANQVVEASYKLTLAEKRLILLVLTKIDSHPDKPAALPETLIEVCASDVVEHFSLPNNKAYEMLTDAAERLYERTVIIDRPDPEKPSLKRTKTRWVSAIDYLPDEGRVSLYLAPKIIPYLTHLAGEFVRYRINQVAGMSSVYAIRLYELLLQWQGEGEREVDIEWLKKAFQVEEAYARTDNLKMRIINPAVAQINANTDFFVSYNQRKRGATIKSFIFTFGRKQDAKPAAATTAPKASTSPKPPAVQPPLFIHEKPQQRTPAQRAKALDAIAAAKKATRGTSA